MVLQPDTIDSMSAEDMIDLLLMLDASEKKDCETSFYAFFVKAWTILEPKTDLNANWHIKFLCDRLQEEMERIANKIPKTRDLIINVPFRTGKTRIVTECLNPWAWTRWPFLKFVTWSYSSDLSIAKTVESRRLIQSPWYQRNWGKVVQLSGDQNVKSLFSNTETGFRKATSTGGTVTGMGGDILIGDDPLNPEQADSEAERNTCNDHYDKTMRSRLNDEKIGVRIIIMQRLHEEDLTGHLLAKDPEGWEHICIPGEESEDIKPASLREFYRGGLFDPVRLDPVVLAGHKISLGSYGYAGQIMQRPSPAVGGMFKKYWWRFWKPKGMDLPDVIFDDEKKVRIHCVTIDMPDRMEDNAQFWDLAFEGDENSSFVVGQAWAKLGPNNFLLDETRGQWDYVATCDAFRAFTKKHPGIHGKYVEKKANGHAMIADLGRVIAGIIPLKAENDKVTRARPASRLAEAGNLYLPHPAIAPWVHNYIDEFANFPKGKFNDRIDATAHMVNKFGVSLTLGGRRSNA